MKDYWVQAKAPAGNWYDELGTDLLPRAIDYAKFLVNDGRVARVVLRKDTVVWDMDQL